MKGLWWQQGYSVLRSYFLLKTFLQRIMNECYSFGAIACQLTAANTLAPISTPPPSHFHLDDIQLADIIVTSV